MAPALDRPLYGASWGAAVARYVGNYARFRGRASRSEYWWWALTNVLITIALNWLGQTLDPGGWRDGAIGLPLSSGSFGSFGTVAGVIALVYGLGTLIPNFALTWRRLHDTNRGGAWFFLVLIPIVGWIVLFFFLIGRPHDEGRRFD